jgi:hypothetical protein
MLSHSLSLSPLLPLPGCLQVTLEEIATAWKVEQSADLGGGATACVATLELRRGGALATRFRGRELLSDFVFRAHSWPR